MAAYNSMFQAGYQPAQIYYPPIPAMQQYTQPGNAYQSAFPPQGTQMQQSPGQMMTPTIRAEIVQVDNEQAAMNFPVGAGSSQMMIAKDDSFIAVKTAYANGQATLDVFVKRQQSAPETQLNLSQYVTWDALEKRLEERLSAFSQNFNAQSVNNHISQTSAAQHGTETSFSRRQKEKGLTKDEPV